LKTHNKFEYII